MSTPGFRLLVLLIITTSALAQSWSPKPIRAGGYTILSGGHPEMAMAPVVNPKLP